MSEDRLAARLEKVTGRLATGALNLERPGADLIAYYLSQDRLPIGSQWSRKHTHTQRRLCERFAVPVIGAVLCQDITIRHMNNRHRTSARRDLTILRATLFYVKHDKSWGGLDG